VGPYSEAPVKRLSILALLLVATGAIGPAQAEPRRFMNELERFARTEGAAPVREGGALFLGSSSVRLWDLGTGFPGAQAVNHGFGGATVSDVLASYDLLVAGHVPETIIVYVGENDLALGRSARDVAGDVGTLLARLRGDYPKARIAYLSIKYAPVRWSLRGEIARANRLIRKQARSTGGFDYIDVSKGLLAAEQPDVRLFGADGLHLSTDGYGRWNRIVAGYLAPPVGAGPVAAARGK
jgi:lysophospholipase L1-like esterase